MFRLWKPRGGREPAERLSGARSKPINSCCDYYYVSPYQDGVIARTRRQRNRCFVPAPEREIELHITGNMERQIWGFDGKKYSEAKEPIPFDYGERLRVTFVNDTMMDHPMHLHGMWMVLENGADAKRPLNRSSSKFRASLLLHDKHLG